MRKPGSGTKYPKEVLAEAVKDYLNNDMTAEETGAKYHIPKAVLLYHARKERKKDGIE